ncbi:LADA_0G08394g1_1 [Lachancea dasiensis]|uniref:LADA_0G08394g1_1 n=1 Tax=Lachancea dasiensis TaxID=1072105 RepID=A0A1G4JU05_9SACH|nr:LADA_0G08394g1_1 [Lachancea dasiensis]
MLHPSDTPLEPGRSMDPIPYGVELKFENLRTFEMLNSLYGVENYAQMLFFFEAQLRRVEYDDYPTPPADVLIVLITLSVLPEFGTTQLVAELDPYNVTRASISSRSLKILQELAARLRNPKMSNLHSTQLLRSQFFLLLDHINCLTSEPFMHSMGDPKKRRKTNSGIRIEPTPETNSSENSRAGYRNPYSAYVSALDQKNEILKTTVLTTILSPEGEFWNCVAWALVLSISEDSHLYERSKLWVPLLTLLFGLFELQNDFYLGARASCHASDDISMIQDSPLACLFKSLNSEYLHNAFCDILLLGLDYATGNFTVHPIYHKELKVPVEYAPRNSKVRSLKILESMHFRHRLLNLLYAFLRTIPEGEELIEPRVSEAKFIQSLGLSLSSIDNLTQLRQFFAVYEIGQCLEYMPLIAQATLNESFLDKNCKPVNLVDNIGGVESMVGELIEMFTPSFPPLDSDCDLLPEVLYKLVERCDICLLVILRFWEFVHKSAHLRTRRSLENLFHAVAASDKRRQEFIKEMGWHKEDHMMPSLYPHMEKILQLI